MTHLLGIKAALNTTKPQQSVLDAIAGFPCAGGETGTVGLCPLVSTIVLQLWGLLCRCSVSLLHVACPVQGPVLWRGRSSRAALNSALPAFGVRRDSAWGVQSYWQGETEGCGFGAVGAGTDCG